MAPVSVSDTDVHGMSLTLREGLTISGRLEFSGTRPRPDPQRLTQVPIVIERAEAGSQIFNIDPPSRVQPDGRFVTTGQLPGRYFIRVGGSPPGGSVQSITANGVDVTDAPIDLRRQRRQRGGDVYGSRPGSARDRNGAYASVRSSGGHRLSIGQQRVEELRREPDAHEDDAQPVDGGSSRSASFRPATTSLSRYPMNTAASGRIPRISKSCRVRPSASRCHQASGRHSI